MSSWMKTAQRVIDDRRFWPAALFAVSFGAYVSTLPTTVSFQDSAEFVTVAATLGIAHPSGYPLYVLLGKLFSLIPLGTIPWRVTLLSAVAAAGAISLAYVIAWRLYETAVSKVSRIPTITPRFSKAATAAIVLCLAFSETWWSQAVYAKTYSLHVFLILLAFWLISVADDSNKKLFLAALVCGLAASNHLYLTATTLPFVAVSALCFHRRLRRPSRLWLTLPAAFVLGLLPYLYLPWRYAAGAPYFMDDIGSWREFLDFILRRRYGDIGFGGAWNKSGLVFGLLARPLIDLGPLIAVLAAAAALRLLRRRSAAASGHLIFLIGSFLAAPLVLAVRSAGWTIETEYVIQVYSLAGIAVLAVLAAVGAAALAGRAAAASRRLTVPISGLLLAVLPVLFLVVGWGRMAPYRDGFVEAYGRAMLDSLPPSAVLAVIDPGVIGDTELFVLAYLQVVEKARPDVTVVQYAGIRCFYQARLPADFLQQDLDGARRQMISSVLTDGDLAGRRIFTTFAPEYLDPAWRSRANGAVFELLPSSDGGVSEQPAVLPPFPLDLAGRQFAFGAVVSHVVYNYAAWVAETEPRKASLLAAEAIKTDPEPDSADYRGFVAHRATVTASVGER